MTRDLLVILAFASVLSCDSWFIQEESQNVLEVYDAFYSEVDQYFSFFEYLNADFDSAYEANRRPIEQYPTDAYLTSSLQELVNFLEDGHTDVFVRDSSLSYQGWFEQYPVNQVTPALGTFLAYNFANDALEYGILNGWNIGYIKINTFSSSVPVANFEQIDEILDYLESTDSMVIDVRSNTGGNSEYADLIISRFNDEIRLSQRTRQRANGGRFEFTEWEDIYTTVHNGERYLKPVAVLTNRRSFSATEWFVAGMKTIPYARVFGDTTGGGSGNPLSRQLPNGWSMRVSNTQKQLADGLDYQFVGIPPDFAVQISEQQVVRQDDEILDTAIFYLLNTNE